MSVKKGDRTSITSNNFWCRLFKERKGQLTIFIIVGIVILFVTAGILYVSKQVVKEDLAEEGEITATSVPQEFQPIQTYTENCLKDIGKKGLLILGEQGGYIYPDVVGKYSATDPTNADGLNLEPLKVPYWYYNFEQNKRNKIVYRSLQPKLYAKDDSEMSVETQLQRFVEEKLDGCLQEYSSFMDQGFKLKRDDKKEIIVKIGEKGINFKLEMPFTAQKGEAFQDFEQFIVRIPLPLKRYFEVAGQITNVEQNYSFLERHALDILSTYAAVDTNKLPPMEAVTFDAIPTIYWTEVDVKEKVKGLLMSKVPMLRYLGSDNFYRYEFPVSTSSEVTLDLHELFQKNYDNTIIPLDLGKGFTVNFDYFGWEPYFDLNDKGGRVEPSHFSANYFKLKFATQHYYNTYDVSYPVLISIHDPTVFGDEGYTFIFALEANIRNNEIIETESVLPLPIAGLSQSMACDESKRNTEPIQTLVIDSYTKEPLADVQIGFSIPNQDDCIMGVTDDNGKLEQAYPAVYGGVGSFIKKDYLTNFYPIDTYNFKKQKGIIGYAVAGINEKVVEMHKIKPINVKIKKKMLHKCIHFEQKEHCFGQGLFGSGGNALYSYTPTMLGDEHRWVYVNAPVSLSSKESSTIILSRVGDINPLLSGDDLVASFSVKGSETTSIELVPGIYTVTGLLFNEQETIIPEEERCDGDDCFTYDLQVLKKMLTGQVAWDDPKTYLTITPEQLYGSQEITFYVLAVDENSVPALEHYRVVEDIQVTAELMNISKKMRVGLEPKYT